MSLVSTVRTGKSMTLSDTTQSTTRTILTGVGRIDILHQQAAPFGGIRDALAHQSTLPLAQTAARALSYTQFLGRLWQPQALEHHYRVIRCPHNQFSGGLLTKCA